MSERLLTLECSHCGADLVYLTEVALERLLDLPWYCHECQHVGEAIPVIAEDKIEDD